MMLKRRKQTIYIYCSLHFQLKYKIVGYSNIGSILFVVLSNHAGTSMVLGSLLLVLGSFVASRKLHNRLLECLLGAPISWYYTTSVGKICSRFGSDLNRIDMVFASHNQTVLNVLCSCGGAFLVVIVVVPVSIPLVLPLVLLFGIINVSMWPIRALGHLGS